MGKTCSLPSNCLVIYGPLMWAVNLLCRRLIGLMGSMTESLGIGRGSVLCYILKIGLIDESLLMFF